MKTYPKIQSVFKREEQGKRRLIEGEWATPELEFLQGCLWHWTEKVDGTNIRIAWDANESHHVRFGGRTDDAQLHVALIRVLQDRFPAELLQNIFGDGPVCLYGEGYGSAIGNKAGKLYKADGADFVLFDVRVGEWWLERHNVEDVAKKLDIEIVPIIGAGTLAEAIKVVEEGFGSTWGDFEAEGLVMRPAIDIHTRKGELILAKIKRRDFPMLDEATEVK